MKKSTVERRIMALAGILINWDKVDANQILETVNSFEKLLIENNYEPSQFGITKENFPSEYIPKSLKKSGRIIATDKMKQCIFGAEHPYSVRPISEVKSEIKLVNALRKNQT